MVNILVFGASTTYGAWDSEGGWVNRLRKYIDQKIIESKFEIDYLIYNLGISGDKTGDLFKRFEVETEARKGKHGEEVVILFHIGINDCIYNESMGRVEVSGDDFRKNLVKLVEMAKIYSKKIVIIGSMPVDSRVSPLPWAPGRYYKNEYVEEYNGILKDVAESERVEFLEIFKEFINKDYSSLLSDGVHMNDEGHRLMYERVRDYLEDKEIIDLKVEG